MKSILIFVLVLSLFAIPAAFAETSITLPDGQIIPLDGLSDTEKQSMMKLANKVSATQQAAKQATGVIDAITSTDPLALNEWRKLITGTIKDIATDLGVGVNEFLKTPAGMGVAALIVYKVAGKEVLGNMMDIVLAIPMWLVIMSALWYLQRQYLTSVAVYGNIVEGVDDKDRKQIVKTNPRQECRYNWESSDARCIFASFLYGTMVVITFVCIIIVFV